jgi:hypothetical protein
MDENEPTIAQIAGQFGIYWIRHGAPGIDWIIIGGESGPGARPFNIQWAQDVIQQCRSAGAAVFVKQLGSSPVLKGEAESVFCPRFKDRKGGDMSEWPEWARVREFPGVAA